MVLLSCMFRCCMQIKNISDEKIDNNITIDTLALSYKYCEKIENENCNLNKELKETKKIAS